MPHKAAQQTFDDLNPTERADDAVNDEVSSSDSEFVNEKKRANELDGKEWTQFSISVWSDIRKTQDEVALGHPAIFPVALVSRLIRTFTNQHDQTVFDPFAGAGSTVLAAKRLGKNGIGIELSPNLLKKLAAGVIKTCRSTLIREPAPSSRITRSICRNTSRQVQLIL